MGDKTKYLLVRLSIRDGEREYTYQCLTNTLCGDIWFAGQRYASKFWGSQRGMEMVGMLGVGKST